MRKTRLPIARNVTGTPLRPMAWGSKLLALAVVAMLCACADRSDTILMSITDVPNPTDATINAAAKDAATDIVSANGTLRAPVLHNLGFLENPAAPARTTTLPGEIVTFASFESPADMRAYISDHSADLHVRTHPIGQMPFISDPKPLEKISDAEDPAFVLINAIGMRSMLNPANPTRMLSYMRQNSPSLSAAGVKFLTPLRIVDGDAVLPDADLLFLTIWPDVATFKTIHEDPNFRATAARTRNRVFDAFTDDRAIALFP